MKTQLLAATLFSLILTGCVSIPQEIQGNSTLLASEDFPAIHKDLASYLDKQVRLGGKVLNVINKNNETLFEVAVLPLDSNARPEINAGYQGRMMVRVAKFIDPLTLNNHLITVLGTLSGSTEGKVGEAQYNFITLNAIGYQVWRVRDNIVPVGPVNYGMGPYWRHGWGPAYGPYPAWGWGWYPQEPRFRVEKQVVE